MLKISGTSKKALFIASILVAAMLIPCSLFAENGVQTINGEVLALEEDEAGTVTAIALSIELENDYQQVNIVMNSKGKELLKELYNLVKVTGTISVQNDEEWVTVTKWERISEFQEEEIFEDEQDIEYSDE